jgi:ATP-binding cassette subfamily A (ABC1) protein 3
VVNNFSTNLYKGQIFCLLGHNGAGKTTLIKILSGMEDIELSFTEKLKKENLNFFKNPEINFENTSLIENKEYLYNNLGLCSQENIIFDDLNVREHLEIMSELKSKEINIEEINNLINKLGLEEKEFSLAKTLSGGQKRKLCIGMALIGNSKIVLLDEPTSGMDIQAKKSLWDFLSNYKENKIIILTTHSLDEAEFLGDRIGIMSEGKLICEGTSSFLKNQYSCGFNLNLLLDENRINNKKKKMIIKSLMHFDSKITIKALGKELMILNFPSVNENVEGLFQTVENLRENCAITNYSITTTTLEDVFIKLNAEEDSKNMFEAQLENIDNQNENDNYSKNVDLINCLKTNENVNDNDNDIINENKYPLKEGKNININININIINNKKEININISININLKKQIKIKII